MAKTTNYEVFYIVKPEFNDAKISEIAERFKGVVESNGGTVEKAELWEKRKLAYEIKGFKEGNYLIMHFSAPAAVPAELSRLMGISDDVLRHRIYKQD